MLVAQTALAQATPPANDNAPSEAARRAALSPYRFILQNASAPARKSAAAPANAAASPQAPEPRRAPSPTSDSAIAARTVPPPAAAPSSAQSAASAASGEPVASLTRKAEEPPRVVRRDIIPVQVDEPKLPLRLVRERASGTVRVQFDINPDGTTTAVKVVSSSNPALNRPTTEAVGAWKFEPVDEILTVQTEVVFKPD